MGTLDRGTPADTAQLFRRGNNTWLAPQPDPRLPTETPGGNIGAMTRQTVGRSSELVPGAGESAEFSSLLQEHARRTYRTPGLSAHVRRMRNWNQGVPRWLVLAIFSGVVVALAIVQFAIR